MTKRSLRRLFGLSAFMSAAAVAATVGAYIPARDQGHGREPHDGLDDQRIPIATGQYVTPAAVKGSVQEFLNPGLSAYPDFVAGMAVRSQLSPDGTTLAIITAGQNSLFKPDGTLDTPASTQFIFLYDVTGPNQSNPVLRQVLTQTNSHVGLVFSPDGSTLYAAGGNDDAVCVYTKTGTQFVPAAPIALNHFAPGATGNARNKGLGINVQPNASGMAISADGATLVVANNYNDSISVIDTATKRVRYEHDLRPFSPGNEGADGVAGGTFPYAVVMKGNETAYVSSDRDREVIAVDVSSPNGGQLVARIKLDGNALGMTLDASQSRLYVAQDNADQVAVINTARNRVVARIDTRAPNGMLADSKYTGVTTSAVTLSPDGDTLYAVNSGSNSIAVIPLAGRNANNVSGLIPTAYEPHDITFSPDGSWMYIVNGKSQTGPNPGHLASSTANILSIQYPGGNAKALADSRAANQYQFQLERASLVSAPVPTPGHLKQLTDQVAANNFYAIQNAARTTQTMQFLRRRIKHVIYIVKENRTFDQILGDLTNGAEVDPDLTQFGEGITPNYHNLARQFVTLDNFMNPGDGSMDGWSWSLQGRVTNTETITQQINYASVNRGLSYESEGANRGVPVNWATVGQRDAAGGLPPTTNYTNATSGFPGGPANLLAGNGNHASTDAPFGIQGGYIFNAVLRAGGSVRNYGFLVNNISIIGNSSAPVRDPFGQNLVQVAPLDPALAAYTDVYFRGYDQNYPDWWRYNEWKREFDQYVANGKLPSLSLVRVSHDHMGNFASALGGVNTPETQQADCDLAVGKMIADVAHSPYADDTLFIITEDDVQDGPDHVDSHRGTAFIVGPYVKPGAVISTHYSQVNVLRTIEDILGAEHINLNTAFQSPMDEVFDVRTSGHWTYEAEASTVLATTTAGVFGKDLGVKYAKGPTLTPKHDAAYWAERTRGFDFSVADQVPPARFNRIIWEGLMANRPYPGRLFQ